MDCSGSTNLSKSDQGLKPSGLKPSLLASLFVHAALLLVVGLFTHQQAANPVYEIELISKVGPAAKAGAKNSIATLSRASNHSQATPLNSKKIADNNSNSENSATESTAPSTSAAEVGSGEVYSVGDLSQAPKLLKEVKAVYPPVARQKLEEGHVLYEMIVKADGRPEKIRKVASTNSVFEEAALHAVEQLVFKPGQKDGQNVAVLIQYRVRFELR